MGINATIVSWLDELASAGHFDGLARVLELGPQDHFFPPELLHDLAARRHDPSAAAALTTTLEAPNERFSVRQRAFYALFGFTGYQSLDPYDDRADLRIDLNTPHDPPERYDCIVDFGTSEHVFNVGNVFRFTHDALRPGGLHLKVLPAFGDNTHGFYNLHPTLYFDVARANDYDLVDFRYVDDMSARSPKEGAHSLLSASDFADQLVSFAGCAALQEKITGRFLLTIERAIAEGRLARSHSAVDYCFVALRKKSDGPFRIPEQGVYRTELSK